MNHDTFADRVVRVATELLGPQHVQTMATPIMGSEDFSYVLQRVTGAFAFLGTKPAEGPAPPNHSNRMIVNESALPARRRHARRRRPRFPRRWGAPKWPLIPPRPFVAPRLSRGAPHHAPRLTPPRGFR